MSNRTMAGGTVEQASRPLASTQRSKWQMQGKVRMWMVAFVLATLLTGLPAVAPYLPGPLSTLLDQAVYAGCQGGTCG